MLAGLLNVDSSALPSIAAICGVKTIEPTLPMLAIGQLL